MKKLLQHIQIAPAENGGHIVSHIFKRTPMNKRGAGGGLSFDVPQPEEHVFGTNEKQKMLAHVANALGVQPEK